MLPKKLAFVDVETTGLNVTRDRIIEIGILRVEDGEIIDTFNSLINPQMHVSSLIEEITGINKEELDTAPTFDEVLHDVKELFSDCVFVAHNARFDYGFIKNEFQRFGFSFHAKCLCTAKLSRKLFPQRKHHNLDAIINEFGFACEKRHRAFDDAKVLVDFYQKLNEIIPKNKLLETCNILLQKPSLPSTLDEKEIENIPECPGVYIFYGEENTPLYVGKSINLKERVLSHFTNDHSSAKEMTMCQQIRRVETITTNGELEALLKESQLIKTILPLYNRVLRVTRRAIVAKTKENEQGYTTIYFEERNKGAFDPEELENIIGIFSSKKRAKDFLLFVAKEHKLCEKLLGLEKTKGACFQYRLGNCNGACVQKEKPIIYNMRAIMAFSKNKIKPWPFSGSIVIKEFDSENKEEPTLLKIDKWCLVDDNQGLNFDMDTYKILYSYIKNPKNHKNINSLTTKF